MEIGKHSRKLVELRKAVRGGTLTSDGLLPVEGPTLLEEANRSGLQIEDMYVRAGAGMPTVAATSVHEVPQDIFKTIQDTEHSQGVIATIRPRAFSIGDVLAASPALILLMCRLQDPGNVGTILRIAESFGATGCIAVSGTASFHNGKVVRASTGSIFRLPHAGGVQLGTAIHELHARNISLVGSSPAAVDTIDHWNWLKPAAILIGNEGAGLSHDELKACDAVLRIPHKAVVESLNSAVAAAVILYEASRQRNAL